MDPSGLNLPSEEELNLCFWNSPSREQQRAFDQTIHTLDRTHSCPQSRQSSETQDMSSASNDNAMTYEDYRDHDSGWAQDHQHYKVPHPALQGHYGYIAPTSPTPLATASSQNAMLFLSRRRPQASDPPVYQGGGIVPSISRDYSRTLDSGMETLVSPYPENGYLELSPNAGPETDVRHQVASTAGHAYDLPQSPSAEVSDNMDALRASCGAGPTPHHLGHDFSSSSYSCAVSDHQITSPRPQADEQTLTDANIARSKFLVWDSKTGQEVEQTDKRRRATSEERAGIQLMRFLRACDNCRKTKTKASHKSSSTLQALAELISSVIRRTTTLTGIRLTEPPQQN